MRSTSAALCCGFTEAERPPTQQAARRRPGSTRLRQPGWPSEGPARGIALRIGMHAAYARRMGMRMRPARFNGGLFPIKMMW